MAGAQYFCDSIVEPFFPNKSYKVNVSHVNDAYSFYVRLLKSDEYLKDVEECGEAATLAYLTMNTIVIYNSEISKKSVRGQIKKRYEEDDELFDMFAVDYGFVDKEVDISDIFLPKTTVIMPPLATHCKLADYKPNELLFSHEDQKNMLDVIENEPCMINVKYIEDDKTVVELYSHTTQNIANMLTVQQFKKLGLNKLNLNYAKKKETPTFTVRRVKVNDILNVRILPTETGDPATLFVAEVNEYNLYVEGRQEFSIYCKYEKFLEDDDFKVGMSVGHRPNFKRYFERAIIKNIVEYGEKAELYLIDYGRMVTCRRDTMKKVKLDTFFTLPGIAFQCTFVQGEEPTDLSNLTPGTETWIKVLKRGNPNYVEVISCPESLI